MSFEWRGGIPTAQRVTGIDGTGRQIILEREQNARVTSKFLRLKNVGANALQIFWTEDDFTLGAEYTTLPVVAATETGILELPIEASSIWVKAAAGTSDLEILALHRRG